MKNLLYLFIVIFSASSIDCNNRSKEVLDVVIPLHEKDAEMIDCVIDAVQKNISKLGKIYIVSKEKYSDRCIWIDEAKYPFTIKDVGDEIGGKGGVGNHNRRGWYYQQILKFYIFDVIEGLSDYVLILDGDTKPAKVMNFIQDGKIYCDKLDGPCIFQTYYRHMHKVVPHLNYVEAKANPVIHHAVFKRDIIKNLMTKVEEVHNKPFWKVFLNSVDMRYGTSRKGFYVGASEYMIYYHFCMNYYRDQVIPRIVRIFERNCKLNREYDLDVSFISAHKYIL